MTDKFEHFLKTWMTHSGIANRKDLPICEYCQKVSEQIKNTGIQELDFKGIFKHLTTDYQDTHRHLYPLKPEGTDNQDVSKPIEIKVEFEWF